LEILEGCCGVAGVGRTDGLCGAGGGIGIGGEMEMRGDIGWILALIDIWQGYVTKWLDYHMIEEMLLSLKKDPERVALGQRSLSLSLSLSLSCAIPHFLIFLFAPILNSAPNPRPHPELYPTIYTEV
jgi:hypothetical protein